METTPADQLADWFEASPSAMGHILAYRVAMMLPRSVPVVRADTQAGLLSLTAWIRDSADGIQETAGVALMVAALVDYVMEAPSSNIDPGPPGNTEASVERYRAMTAQDERLRETWQALRAGPLSMEGIDRWTDDVMKDVLRSM